jgi:hypothetical protein
MDEGRLLKERLAATYLPGVSLAATNLAFRFAWDAGHASGIHEVEQVYEEVAEVVLAATKERGKW